MMPLAGTARAGNQVSLYDTHERNNLGHGHSNPRRARREFQRDLARDRAAAAGREAAMGGFSEDQNPYDRGSQPQEHFGWSIAFREAHKQIPTGEH